MKFDVKVIFAADKIMKTVEKAATTAVRREAYQMFAAARQKVGTQASGRKGAPPGRPPLRRSGKLQRNILYKVAPSGLTADIGTVNRPVSFFGNFLEFGNSALHDSVKARPFMRPTLAEREGSLERMFADML